ncbi:endospore germination permease [Domibacillus sp. DTU_2020_1001157_1_SI_ALB_TIR_016]|uniref:GerAB/ArcD/ProY family transporter n=1 Tax=Domibacillus sp. DTU_2020_1001157_1_SI_ALB_TIR_016 TaxID=3077789 RepID=UPI0028E32165|nr:endospore germination permease [Domibacillus sp. DTU_2020_1001157_1_SI_ALB_TIR_016]WNS78686.1 endospore germination permease [Domibacillus sp. DTU_2020_1001157_1_SI_ALB_TIR_016]
MGEKMKREASISTWQLFFFMLQTYVGSGILSLPYDVHQVAGKDGWLSILLMGFYMQIGIIVIWLLASRFPNKALPEFLPLIVGRAISVLIIALYMFLFFMTTSQILAVFLSIAADWAFPRTPPIVFAVIVTAITVYLIQEDIRVIARFHVLMSFFLMGVLMIFLFILKYLNVYYLLPIGSSGVQNIVAGAQKAIYSLAGMEMLLWLFPLTQANNKGKWKAAAGASLAATTLFTLLALCAFSFFSTAKLKHIPEPIIYMIKSIEFGIVERLDLIFLVFWAVFSITSFMNYFYLAALSAASITKAKHHKTAVYVLSLLIIPMSVYTNNAESIKMIGGFLSWSYHVFLFFIPLFLLVIAMIRRKRESTG